MEDRKIGVYVCHCGSNMSIQSKIERKGDF